MRKKHDSLKKEVKKQQETIAEIQNAHTALQTEIETLKERVKTETEKREEAESQKQQ